VSTSFQPLAGMSVGVSATINDHLSLLQGVLPSGALEIIGDQVKRITAKGSTR
jgi:uncharacterized BrkB/YihY/UPF0761 family membrane protein